MDKVTIGDALFSVPENVMTTVTNQEVVNFLHTTIDADYNDLRDRKEDDIPNSELVKLIVNYARVITAYRELNRRGVMFSCIETDNTLLDTDILQ